ncbi:MAG: hypothetical protein R2734_11035 [Nocardioides sp.]
MTDTEPAGTGELSDVVEAFRALLQIPTVSYSDPAQVGQPSLRPLPLELARQFPLLHERLEVTRIAHGLLVRWPGPFVRGSDARRADGAPGRRAYRPQALAAILLRGGRRPGDLGGDPRRQGSAGRDLRGGRATWPRFEPAGDLALLRLRRGGPRGSTARARRWPSCVATQRGSCWTRAAPAHERLPDIATPVAVIGVAEEGVTSLGADRPRAGRAARRRRLGWARRHGSRGRSCGWTGRVPGQACPTAIELQAWFHAPTRLRPLLANAERLRPVLTRALVAAGPEAAALTRTTIATTMLSGSPAINVIASTATAGLNARIMVSGIDRHRRACAQRRSGQAGLDPRHRQASGRSPCYDGDEA